MKISIRTAIALGYLAAALTAQGVSGVVTPNPAPIGQAVSLTITNATGATIQLPSSCAYQTVRAGTPTGPVIDAPICLTVLTPIAPCGTRTQGWSPPPNLLAGTYWFEVRYWDANFTQLSTEFFCFSYQGSGAPALGALTTARIGQDLVMDITAPGYGGAAYIVAASLTTNTGFTIPNLGFACLDLDAVFFLSFPSPNPVLFANFQGTLPNTGYLAGPTVHIPGILSLVCLPLHAQAVLLPNSPSVPPALTNALNFSIAP